MVDIIYVSIHYVNARNHPYMMKIMQTNFLVIFFRRGYPSLFFSFLGIIYFRKPSKMIFGPKKMNGSLQKCLKNDLNLPNIKFGGKKIQKKLNFFSNSHFLGYENATPKSKNRKKGLVQDLKIALR